MNKRFPSKRDCSSFYLSVNLIHVSDVLYKNVHGSIICRLLVGILLPRPRVYNDAVLDVCTVCSVLNSRVSLHLPALAVDVRNGFIMSLYMLHILTELKKLSPFHIIVTTWYNRRKTSRGLRITVVLQLPYTWISIHVPRR